MSGLSIGEGVLKSNKNEVENGRLGVVDTISLEFKAKWTRLIFLKLRIIECSIVFLEA